MISHADYEIPDAQTVELAAAGSVAPVVDPVTSSATAAMAVSRETAAAPTPQHVQTKENTTADVGQAQDISLPPQPALNAETAAPAGEAELDESPTKDLAGPGQVNPFAQDTPEEPAENVVRPELPSIARDFKNRFDAARDRLRNDAQNPDEMQELLDQAITLLDSISQHPAIRDYGASKRKLEEIEQRLGYGSYPQ
jgi:hypothetical protein